MVGFAFADLGGPLIIAQIGCQPWLGLRRLDDAATAYVGRDAPPADLAARLSPLLELLDLAAMPASQRRRRGDDAVNGSCRRRRARGLRSRWSWDPGLAVVPMDGSDLADRLFDLLDMEKPIFVIHK
ncbi:hypothetical protein ACLOJK_006490 [Asimina triloba]